MQGVKLDGRWVFLYSTMLHTASPLLKEIYCESHRLEPWAVRGSERRMGRYAFPNVLYVEARERDALLETIPRALAEEPDWVPALMQRFKAASRIHQRCLAGARRGDWRRATIESLIDATCKVLSCGIFKEVFEYGNALDFLGRFMPTTRLRDRVLALYQPLCIPHFLKFELKLAYFSALYAGERSELRVAQCIAQCAHHSRFFIEDTPFDDPAVMRKEMDGVIAVHGGADSIFAHRKSMLRRHRDAIREALLAERDILQILNEQGRYTLGTKLIVKNCIRFVQLIATYEEIKHIFTVQTAKVIGTILKARDLACEDTDITALLLSLSD
jgi:hypothetical protein